MPNIALVTGASSGLGREFVKRIDAGFGGPVDEIWAVARRTDRLDALVRTCSTPVRAFSLDLTDPVSFDFIEAALGETAGATVTLLVNNAGAGTFGAFSKQGKDDAPKMMALLMRAPVELMYRTLPYMRPGSRIINVASVAAFTPQPELAVYSCAKRFVFDVTRALDAELAGTGIHATAVCPKYMKTEFFDSPGDAGAAERMSLVGFERAEDVAVAALAASRAGRSVCIPSPDMKAYYALTRLLPYKATLAIQKRLGVL